MRRVTGQLAELAATTAAEAERLLANAKQALRRAKAKADKLRERGTHDAAAGRRRGRLARAVDDLTELLEATRQIVAHTRQRRDFMAIATMLVGDPATVSDLPLSALTENAIRKAFADYAQTHEAASIRRCWSTWNTLCTFLYTSEMIAATPMPLVGRPKVTKSLPKGLGVDTVSGLTTAVDADKSSSRHTDWAERDRALVLTGLLAGLRARRTAAGQRRRHPDH